MDADAIELRVLGCLLEKQRTTPDQYPLSLNALRLACNQTTNRDPVVAYDEGEIHDALQRLARRLDAARERSGQPRCQVPPALRDGARARRCRGRRALRPHAPRRPDARRAQAANRAAASFARAFRTIQQTLDGLTTTRARRATRSPARPEGGALPAPPRRRRNTAERSPQTPAPRRDLDGTRPRERASPRSRPSSGRCEASSTRSGAACPD
jgi:hypothetical protein